VHAIGQVVLSTQRGTIVRQRVSDITIQRRSATGVRVQRLDEGNHILSVAVLARSQPEEEVTGVEGGV
jgi:DNA gyrase subunit A